MAELYLHVAELYLHVADAISDRFVHNNLREPFHLLSLNHLVYNNILLKRTFKIFDTEGSSYIMRKVMCIKFLRFLVVQHLHFFSEKKIWHSVRGANTFNLFILIPNFNPDKT